jgi:hypothetical protein
VTFRQHGSNNHSNQGAAKYHREHKERDRQIVHTRDLSANFGDRPTQRGTPRSAAGAWHVLICCVAGSSVYPAANDNGPPWRNNSTPDNRSANNHGAASGDAACTIHAARADDGACLNGGQGDEASRQQ